MKTGKYLYWLIGAALAIKLISFLYIAFVCSSFILQNDSFGYLNDAKIWVNYLSFPSEGFRHSLYRTPGYSLFLAVFHLNFNLPYLSIILLQYVLIVLTAFVVFKTITLIDQKAALLGAAIVLLDLPTTIYSSMIMSESLHVFVLSLFIYYFVRYIIDRHLFFLAGAVFLLGVSVYIRPVGYFLGLAVAAFVLYLWGLKKFYVGFIHAIVTLLLVYGFLWIWQYHNLKTHGEFTISSIDRGTILHNGIIGRYEKETDPKFKLMPPVLYYVETVGRNFLSLMTTPGSIKYFHSDAWFIFGAVFGYIFVIFWWIGLVAGLWNFKADIVSQFLFLVLLYFITISLVSTGWLVTPRFRVPMIPLIAILSARGWMSWVR